jgi:hypothetical protein
VVRDWVFPAESGISVKENLNRQGEKKGEKLLLFGWNALLLKVGIIDCGKNRLLPEIVCLDTGDGA